ncbi:tRNA lysidine(34) synthetase TilS [Asinibacterium sp. OR53]|uniref:tRNA lysidine(34) synthetase TilS n=1 Tax=Asinibacterium sp. OR53 TaxID=925409 RepID=UPI0004787470|nr:tRNA lysidine(34) synthetase TilS [Asinibacterium sp. OR53]
MLQSFNQHWKRTFPHLTPQNCRLLLAVSGGVDSVVLTHLVAQSGFNFRIAHCNFQLRGEESERDEQFVLALGKQYGKEVLIRRFDTGAFASARKMTIQEAARELRYAWFNTIREDSWLVTAHHADDNIETMLMHLFRGTGIKGLAGIQAIQEERALLRPLLPFRKQELLEYAREAKLDFVEDSSNSSDKYTRNFFRHQLIPGIREVFPQAEENILHTIEHLKEALQVYDQSIHLQLGKLIEKYGNEIHIPVLKWKQATPLHTLTREMLKPYGFTTAQTAEAIKLLDASNGSYLQSPTHRLIRNRKWMIIAENANEQAAHIIIEETDSEVRFAEKTLKIQSPKIKSQNISVPSTASEAFLDAAKISFPLLLRKWKQGDYFYPLGMQKKKKLSRFFIDLKLSATDKEKVWVLEMDKKIIWVIGYRIDDRFKIIDTTTDILQFKVS